MLPSIEPNFINKIKLYNHNQYIQFVLSLMDSFPSICHFESHFKLTPYDEKTHPEEYKNGEIQIETIKFKPKRYPCIYVFCPLEADDGSVGGWMIDDFIYPTDF